MSFDVLIYRLLLLVAAMALATIALGWWGVLFVAIAFAIIDRRWSVPAEAAFSAAVAWLALFVVNAIMPGVSIVTLMARAMTLPWPVLPILTVGFPLMLGWSGATVAVAVAHLLGRRRLVAAPRRIAD